MLAVGGNLFGGRLGRRQRNPGKFLGVLGRDDRGQLLAGLGDRRLGRLDVQFGQLLEAFHRFQGDGLHRFEGSFVQLHELVRGIGHGGLGL